MTELYNGTEWQTERARKKLWLTLWWILTGIVIAVNVGLFVYFCLQPYQWKGRTTLFVIQIANVAVYACLSFAFFALKYRRLKFYCKMLKNMNQGLKEIYTGEYIGISVNTEAKEGIDFFVMLVMEYNPLKGNYFERKVLIDVEKDPPVFKEGDIVHFVTQANMLMSYETLERPADEATMEEKRRSMAAKDKERLFDNVIIDADAIKKLKSNKRKRRQAELSDGVLPELPEQEDAEARETEPADEEQENTADAPENRDGEQQ